MGDTQQTTEEMQSGQKTVMLSKIEDMQTRFLGSDLARDMAYAAHRDMLHCIQQTRLAGMEREFPTMFSIADRAKKHREKKAVKR